MKSVSVIHIGNTNGKDQYAIRYSINSVDKKLISDIDTIIYKGHCEYFGIPAVIPEGFSFNITNATICIVDMYNMPHDAVYKTASKIADLLKVLLNVNQYVYK